MHHKSKDSEHGSTAVIKLNSTLLKLGLLRKSIPSEINVVITEVTNELSSSNILHDQKLQPTNEEEHLKQSLVGNLLNSSPSVGDRFEGSSREINISWKSDSSTGDDVSEESKLGDTSVLDLDVTESVELSLGSIVEHTEGIEESDGSLDSKLRLEGAEGGGGLGNLGGSKGSSRSEEGGEDGELHVGYI